MMETVFSIIKLIGFFTIIVGLCFIPVAIQAWFWSNWHANILKKYKGKREYVKTTIPDIIGRVIIWWALAMVQTWAEHNGFSGGMMDQKVVIDFFVFVILNAVVFWIFFDPMLNVKRDPPRGIFYVSTYNHKLLDAMFHGSALLQYAVKAVFLVGLVIFSMIVI